MVLIADHIRMQNLPEDKQDFTHDLQSAVLPHLHLEELADWIHHKD
jgi:hypothetical protein